MTGIVCGYEPPSPSEALPLSPTTPSTFSKFKDFPAEIQLQIWKSAIPDPRVVDKVIVIIINGDLSHPKGFLPTESELSSSELLLWNEADYYDYDGRGDRVQTGMDMESRSQIMNLMQACRNSRRISYETYRLQLPSRLPEENIPFWQADDLVYFRCSEIERLLKAMLRFLSNRRDQPLNGFDSIRHLALLFDRHSLTALNYFQSDDFAEEDSPWECAWHENFPAMESLSLLLDPSKLHQTWNSGKIVLYPPMDVPIWSASKLPATMELEIERCLKEQNEVSDVIVDVYVMLRRRHKKIRR